MNKSEKIWVPIEDLPQELIEAVKEELFHFTVGLVKIKRTVTFRITDQSLENLKSEGIPNVVLQALERIKNQEFKGQEQFQDNLKTTIGDGQTIRYRSMIFNHTEGFKEDASFFGSGTFVAIDNIYGILTADHVFDRLDTATHIGLVTRTQNADRCFIPKKEVQVIRVARGPVEWDGPDLGFIVLPQVKIGDLKARKSFFNLSSSRERMLNNPPENNFGIWCLFGMVSDKDYLGFDPERGYQKEKRGRAFCLAGDVHKEYLNKEFDYFELEIDFSASDKIPRDFKGFSGGGLWQVPLGKKEDDTIPVPLEYILSGVAFCQSDTEGTGRFIKCHGRRSIYDYLINKVLDECS